MPMRRRKIGGIWFRCLSPGSWLSESGQLSIVHMMAGTPHEQWELHLTTIGTGRSQEIPADPDSADFLCDDFVCGSVDFGGHALAEDVRKHAQRRASNAPECR